MSVDERLNQMSRDFADLDQRNALASTAPAPGEESTPPIPLTQEFSDEGIQVAGGKLDVIKEVIGKLSKVDIRKSAPPPVTKEAQQVADIADTQKAAIAAGVTTSKTQANIAAKIEVKKPDITPEGFVQIRQDVKDLRATTPPELEKPPVTEFNFPRIETEDDIKSTIEAMNRATDIKTENITFDDVRSAVEKSGIGPKFFDDVTSGKLEVNPQNTYKALNAMVASAKHLDGLAQKVASGAATPTELAEMAQTVHFHSLLQQSVKNYQTNVAQSLAVMRIPRDGSVDMTEMLAQFGNQSDIVKFAQAYLDIKTPEGKADLIRGMAQGNAWEKLFTVYVNGLLSRPGTQLKNALSNTIFLPWRMTERAIASGIGSVRTGLGIGTDTAYNIVEVPAMLASSPTAVSNGWQLMSHAFTNGVPKGWSDPTKIARQQARMELFDYRADGSMLSAAMKGMNYVVTLPGRSLMAADEFFKGVNYTFELAAESSRIGIKSFDDALKAGASNADAMKAQQNAIDQFLIEPPDYIASLAEKGTFTQKLEGDLGKALSSINPNTATGFAIRTQIPFITTPVNVMAEVVSRSPLAFASKGLWTDVLKGGSKESDMAIAKIGLGSGAMYGFSNLATNGNITGSGPGEKGTREAMIRQGWQPHSVVVDFDGVDEGVRQALSLFPGQVRYGSGDYEGKVFLSYQGMEPVGALMAMSADYTDYARYEQDNSKINAIAGGLVFGIANYMMESPFLQGVSNIMTAFGNYKPNNPNGIVLMINSLTQIATTTAMKAVTPLSGLVTSVAEKFDPTRRDYQINPNAPAGLKGLLDGLNKVRAQTPGLSQDMDPVYNIWAEPVDHEFSWSPIRMKAGKTREVDQALIQLNAQVAMPSREVSMVDPTTGLNANTKLSTPEYNRMLEIANKTLNLEDQVMSAIKMVEADNGRNDLIRYQNTIRHTFENVFNGSETVMGAKKLLLQDAEFGDEIQRRIADKAQALKKNGLGAK
jgi:hypothetical protein